MLGGAHQGRDIAVNGRNGGEFACFVMDRRGGEGKFEALPVLAPPPHDLRVWSWMMPRLPQFFAKLRHEFLRHDQIDEAAAGQFFLIILKKLAK